MSLLIDALKRAELAKNGQAESDPAPRNTVERAVDNATTALDWSLTESSVDPVIGAARREVTEPPTRTEPRFTESVENVPLREPTVATPVAATHTTKSWNNSKSDQAAAAQERAAAKTLFDAKRPATRSHAGVLALLGLATLILAAGGFYVWYSLAFPPSPAARPAHVLPVAPAAAVNVTPAPDLAAEAPPARTKAAETSPSPPLTAAVAVETPSQAGFDDTEKPSLAPPNVAKRKSKKSDTDAAPAGEFSSAEIVRREIVQARRSQLARRAKTNAANGAIKVGRDERSEFDADITLAYNSLLSGNRAEAKRLYGIAAQRDPFNTDALLGLASIAGNVGDLSGAEQYFRRALELDPQNAAAIAGLASIGQPGGPSESQLKFELARTPDSAPLRFALGNQLANQGRWDEAQQAYFDAFSADASNADYAYNLAVSLDQLNQSKQAVAYYRKALDLAKGRTASFRSSDISTRLTELGQVQ
jgi:Tfp pilus assembly protein PilF